jgi:putative NADH-flavin reductase
LFKGTFAGAFKQEIMKLVVTGSLGNISKPLTQILVEKGHDVTVISKDAEKAMQIEAVGAKAAIGSVSDTAFLTSTFKGADAVYTMVPPNWTVSNYRQYIGETGLAYRNAIEASGVRRVVNLSSIGAHLSNGTGPIAGLYDVEQTFNTLKGVAIRHLRAGIGKPDLPWVQFSDEDAFKGMKNAGMSEAIARVYVEMGMAIESGVLFEDFEAHKPREFGSTKLTDFVNEFAAVYNSRQ